LKGVSPSYIGCPTTHTKAQAIEDGTFIDVSSLAKEAGFRYPVVGGGLKGGCNHGDYQESEASEDNWQLR